MQDVPTKRAVVNQLALILMTGVLYEAETAFPSRAPVFTTIALVMRPTPVVFLVFCPLLYMFVFVLSLVLSVDCVS